MGMKRERVPRPPRRFCDLCIEAAVVLGTVNEPAYDPVTNVHTIKGVRHPYCWRHFQYVSQYAYDIKII